MKKILAVWELGDEQFTIKQITKKSGYTKITTIKKLNQLYELGLVISDNCRPMNFYLTEKGKTNLF